MQPSMRQLWFTRKLNGNGLTVLLTNRQDPIRAGALGA